MACEACPRSIITGAHLQELQDFWARKRLRKGIGGMVNLDELTASEFDTLDTLELVHIEYENARLEAEHED